MNTIHTTELINTGKRVFAQTYTQLPIIVDSAAGCTVTDTDGNSYLDFVAGIAVNALGYGDKELAASLHKVIDSGITHCSNLYWNAPAIEAASNLVQLSGLTRVFFCNSGAEANEAALKLARKYGHEHKGPNANMVISMKNSFHGRTYGAVTATGQQKYHKGFSPMMPDIAYAAFNDLTSVQELITKRTCAIIVEPVQGEGGIIPATREFLAGLRSLCDREDILLLFDEVQCGMGRLGTPFAYQQFGVIPDAVSLAKGLGAGVPAGALVIGKKAAETFVPGDHASTFGGNLLAGAAAACMTRRLSDQKFMEHIAAASTHLSEQLQNLQTQFPDQIQKVRGKGLMMGLVMNHPVKPVIAACLEKGLLLIGAGTDVIRLVPPLIISKEEIDQAAKILQEVLLSQSQSLQC